MKADVKKVLTCCVLCSFVWTGCQSGQQAADHQQEVREKTAFQTSQPWRPTIDNRADVAIVYGVGGNPSDKKKQAMTFEERVQSWRDHGYITHFMTGSAWGEYQDYFTGQWDGKWHLDEGQVTKKGDTIWHGYMVPYIVPSKNFIKYMQERHIKREWKEYYGFDWRPQHESAENTYLSNKLNTSLKLQLIR